MRDYILFIPPIEVAEKKPREWSNKEANIYFDWFISTKEDRVDYMLTSIDESLTNNPQADVNRIGGKITMLLFEHPFSTNHGNELIITNKGLALVADLSLFISKLIIENHPQITWGIVKRPKRDVSYNLPAMFGFPLLEHIELIGASINNARAILENNKTYSIWGEMYKYAIELISGNVD